MSCIPSLLVIIFTLISVIEGRGIPIIIPTSVEGWKIFGYVIAGIVGLIILLFIIFCCIGLVNEAWQRVGSQPGTDSPPPHPNRQANHRAHDPLYTAGSAFPPPLRQSPSPPQPQEMSPQIGLSPLSPLSVNPPGQNEVDSVAAQPSSQANEEVRGQNGKLPPLKPLRPTASGPPTDHDV